MKDRTQRPAGHSTFNLQLSTLHVPLDVERIVQWIGDASIVLLGEATHGSHEFYEGRAAITRQLIERKGFRAVAIEGDWPDAYRVNRYVQGMKANDVGVPTADKVLAGFARFPEWMWRNTAVRDFVEWLKIFNSSSVERERADSESARSRSPLPQVGFYGLDLYSLHASIRSVVAYLERVNPAAATGARHSYGCFDHFGPDTGSYAWATQRLGERSCEEAVARELAALHRRRAEYLKTASPEHFFDAEQNAQLVVNAERYYRTMMEGRVSSWNLRDSHMADTVVALLDHLSRKEWIDQPSSFAKPTDDRSPGLRLTGRPSALSPQLPARIVIWAHNSHVGDARATELGDIGEHTLGQLMRERFPGETKLIGFTTYAGAVMAASEWGGMPEVKTVRPGLKGSYEEIFHRAGLPSFFLPLSDPIENRESKIENLPARALQRAIGVIYLPEMERQSHYFNSTLAQQFDAVIHFDQTTAVRPLAHVPVALEPEVPETFPSGI